MASSFRTPHFGCLISFLILFIGVACNNQRDQPEDSASAYTGEWSLSPAGSLAADTLRAIISGGTEFDARFPWLRPIDESLEVFYRTRDYRPAWFDQKTVPGLGSLLLEQVQNASQDGLHPHLFQPERLDELLNRVESDEEQDASLMARTDLELSRVFMHFASVHLEGLVDPQGFTERTYLNVEEVPLDSLLTITLLNPEGGIRERLIPQTTVYEHLVEARGRYRELERAGGWMPIPAGEVIEPDQSDPRVPLIRQRLAATGEWSSTVQEDSVYTRALAGAVARFQKRHAIVVDSLVGPGTQEAMNMSAADRARQIELNLERLRWLPRELGPRHALVNIPEFRVYGFDQDRIAVEMKVVVGSDYGGRQTPVFADQIEHVVFNPYWNVPNSIAVEEIVPSMRRTASYLSDRGFEGVNQQGEVVPARHVSTTDIVQGGVRIRQRPVPENALGQVKFMFPNQHAIYLHDTPAEALFKKFERTFSHGCIRLEDPPAFGEYVLGSQGWSAADVRAEMMADERREVALESPLPVYILYLTAFEHGDRAALTMDVYGLDEELDRQLKSVLARAED